MNIDTPISIAVCGHPLLESVAISWSANEGMVPQSLLFGSEGGTATATVSSLTMDCVSIQYHAKITFNLPDWGLIEISDVKPLAQGGDQISLDPGAWIKYLTIQLQVDSRDDDRSKDNSHNHLVVNFTWQNQKLNQFQKDSGRITPATSLKFAYIQDEDYSTEITLSAFGVINGQLKQLPAQSITLEKDFLLLLATSKTIQLIQR